MDKTKGLINYSLYLTINLNGEFTIEDLKNFTGLEEQELLDFIKSNNVSETKTSTGETCYGSRSFLKAFLKNCSVIMYK